METPTKPTASSGSAPSSVLLVVGALLVALLQPLYSQELVQVPVEEYRLPNGMRLLLVQRPDTPMVAAGWVARAGSADDRPGLTGLSHLMEHLLFKGSRVGSKQDWNSRSGTRRRSSGSSSAKPDRWRHWGNTHSTIPPTAPPSSTRIPFAT
jgi:hypothetical protein